MAGEDEVWGKVLILSIFRMVPALPVHGGGYWRVGKGRRGGTDGL